MATSSLCRHSLALALAAVALGACSSPPAGTAADVTAGAPALEGWSAATHGKGAPTDHAAAFPTDRVARFQITIAPSDWQAMLDDMTRLYGARGAGGQRPPGGGMGATARKPMWAPATITYDGRVWEKVGVRFKGNSSLRSAWQGGTDALPLKIDFDEFEDQYPAIKDQRFYGFQQLSLGTNWNDAALMRDTLASDILHDAGLVAAETGFYEVVLDRGEGARRLGVYTAVEVIDDTVVKRAFGKDKGNLYEAEGTAASLAAGLRDRLSASFQKENNQDTGWGDLEAFYDVLHAPERTTDPAAWRRRFEAAFDVDVYLRWLGIAAALGHWDTYGGLGHNYYLYHHHETDKLTWISWDHNLILGAMGGGAVPPAGGRGAMSGRTTAFDRTDVGASWPLIRYVLDDPTYHAAYVKALRETAGGAFRADAVQARIQRYAAVLGPASGNPNYAAAVQALSQAAQSQADALAAFLATQGP